MNLSEFSSDVVGFDSAYNGDKDKQVLVRDAGTDAIESKLEATNNSTSTNETVDIGVQATSVVLSNSNEETDKKLAAWLKKIMPALEKELLDGVTPVYNNSGAIERPVKIEDYQNIELKHLFASVKSFSEEELNKGSATWLSVSTQDSPVLVVSVSLNIDGQNSSFVVIFEPQRSKTDAKIYWNELVSIPVKEPIEFLSTNHQNRDMFAGASKAGDLYIWTYHNAPKSSNDPRVTEVFAKASEDSIAALTFLNDNRVLCCLSDGRIVVYKIVNKQNTIIDKVMKIEPRNMKDPLITCIVSIPETDDDFVVGLFNGRLLYCSTIQLVPQDGTFNPIVRELQTHKFAISSLRNCQHQGKSYLVSFDISGEISYHEIGDNLQKQPKIVVKLPLPLKNKISVSNDMERIFCPIEKGSLEVFNTNSKTRESVIEGKLSGAGNIIELSRNESWIVTGIYNGTYKIFHIKHDNK